MRSAEQLRYLILAAQREGNRVLTVALTEIGITPAQSEALRIITEHGPLSINQLGGMLVCDTGANPSRIVDRLVGARLVERLPDEQDRRLVLLAATQSGRSTAAKVAEIEHQIYDSIDHTLDRDHIETLIAALRILTNGSPAGLALEKRVAAQHDR